MGDAEENRSRGWPWKVGLVVFAVGACCVAGAFLGSRELRDPLGDRAAHSVPGAFEQYLDPGLYVVAFKSTTSERVGPVNVPVPGFVAADRITIRGPAGRIVDIEPDRPEVLGHDGGFYWATGDFEVVEPGSYDFVVAGGPETDVLVASSRRELWSRGARWFVLGTVGTLLVVIGGSMALYGFLRPRRPPHQPRLPPPPAPPTPGAPPPP